MKYLLTVLMISFTLFVTTPLFAVCVLGNVWCENHMQWRCERCGSELCPIFTGNSCLRDDKINDDYSNFDNSNFGMVATVTQNEQCMNDTKKMDEKK
jgi:hypothetical protein